MRYCLKKNYRIARQTMPAPTQLLAELYREENGKNTDAVYPGHEQRLQDIAAEYLRLNNPALKDRPKDLTVSA